MDQIILSVCVSQVSFIVDIVVGVLADFVPAKDSSEQIGSKQLDKTLWVSHEELMACIREYVQLRFPRAEEAIDFYDLTGAPRVHPVLLTEDKRNWEW